MHAILTSLIAQLCASPLIGRFCSSTASLTTQNLTLCGLPFVGALCANPAFSAPAGISANFALLAELEIKAFEELLDEVAMGPVTAIAAKKVQKVSTHLLQAIQASHLERNSKEPLVDLLRQVAKDADQSFVSLVNFHVKIDAAARR